MPLYVQNQAEVYNEDDRPLPANTPSTGSVFDSSRVVECGNRVLEYLAKHKRDIQTKMANNRNNCNPPPRQRKDFGSHRKKLESSASFMERSRIIHQLYMETLPAENEDTSSGNTHMTKTKKPSQPSVTKSDEYLEIPHGEQDERSRGDTNPTEGQEGEEEDAIYEPEEQSDLEECWCNADICTQSNHMNNNTAVYIPPPARFQILENAPVIYSAEPDNNNVISIPQVHSMPAPEQSSSRNHNVPFQKSITTVPHSVDTRIQSYLNDDPSLYTSNELSSTVTDIVPTSQSRPFRMDPASSMMTTGATTAKSTAMPAVSQQTVPEEHRNFNQILMLVAILLVFTAVAYMRMRKFHNKRVRAESLPGGFEHRDGRDASYFGPVL